MAENYRLALSEKFSEEEEVDTEDEARKELLRRKEKRAKIADQYYRLSMPELRSYEGFLKSLILAALNRVGVCVIEDFLPETVAELVKEEIESLFKTNVSPRQSPKKKTESTFRSDEVIWIGASDSRNVHLKKLNATFQNIIVPMARLPELQHKRFKITHRSHAQISKFPKSSRTGYKPHIENPNNNGRLLTVAYYTNKEYSRVEDVGLIRFYLKNNTKFIEVEPKFNTAVIYWCDRRVIKEVLPSHAKDLYHVTSWFFGSYSIT